MVPPLVTVALDHYRDPTAFECLRDPRFALPDGFPRMLSDFCSALAAANIDATAAGSSVQPAELEDAARFLIRHVLLDAPDDYYRCLGVRYNAPANLIKTHYLLLSRILHPDRVPNATEIDVQYARRLNQAYQVLHDPGSRARYDLDRGVSQHRPPSDPQQFFHRRQPTPQWPPAIDDVPQKHFTLARLRFIVPAALLMAVAILFVMTLSTPKGLHPGYPVSQRDAARMPSADDKPRDTPAQIPKLPPADIPATGAVLRMGTSGPATQTVPSMKFDALERLSADSLPERLNP